MDTNDIVIGIAGSGGDGIVAAGDILTQASAGLGIHCLMTKSFGAQIRGGESSCRIRLSAHPILSQGDLLDVLVVFKWSDFLRFGNELEIRNGGYVLVEDKDKTDPIPLKDPKSVNVIRIPFEKLAAEDAKNPKAKNMVSLGVLARMFGLPQDGIRASIGKKFAKRGEAVVSANQAAVDVGAEFVDKNLKPAEFKFSSSGGPALMSLTGNEACAFGALTAGCRFFASYPITPASEIMEWLSVQMPKFGGRVLQSEDEISAVNSAIGASFGGIPSMTATSGPGMSLKLEAIGLASMAELPLVVVNVQRGGPSTGIPTKTEQADLMQAVYGMHGDAPHAVLAPADVADCFDVTWRAFDIAEKYQMPVIILSDQFIGHRKETVKPFDLTSVHVSRRFEPQISSDKPYNRYEDTPSGISPITRPGIAGGQYLASGIEHTREGSPSSQYDTHEKMTEKRARKLDMLAGEYKFIRRYGPSKPKVGVIGWGSSKGAIKEALERLAKEGLEVAALIPQMIYPVQKDLISKFVSECSSILIVELSYSGQFEKYLAGLHLLPPNTFHYRSSGGRVFSSMEIESAIRAAAEGKQYVPKDKKGPTKLTAKDEE